MLQSESTKKYDKYKASGIEWIREIPQHWEVCKILKLYKERKCKNKGNTETNVLSLSYGNIKRRNVENNMGLLPESFETYNVIFPDNIVLRLTDLQNDHRSLRCGLVKEQGIITSAYVTLEKKLDDISSNYYYRLLHTFDIMKGFYGMGDGVRQNLKYDGELCNLLLVKPPFNEQQQIADYLDKKCGEIDRVVETEKAVIERLKEYKQAVITEVVTKGLDKSVPLKDSGIEWIGKIPEHWGIIKLKRMVETISDIDHYMPKSVDNGYPYLMTGDLKDCISKIDFENCKKISENDYNDLSSKIHPILDDIIFARYATIGTLCYVDIAKDFLVSYSCLTIRPKQREMFGKFLYYYLKSDNFKIDVTQYINSNTQSNIGLDALQKVYIMLPNTEEQQQIADYLDKKCSEIDKAISDKEKLIEKLTEYKKSLIYECVTGKRKVV